ncbi:MAG: ATPase [Pelagibacteraceae bacterium]|nr:ATPase [Pelagibacteraceae bacterium]
MKTCKKCNLPETYETIVFNENGCNICVGTNKYKNIDWAENKKKLLNLVNKYKSQKGYDCIIPFSGGKDSTFQVHYAVKELKLKPLVVRFNHGFLRPKINSNTERFLKKIGVDFIDFSPNWKIVRFLMEESFRRKGDFCWHCHTGIFAYPLRLAVSFNVPLVIYGEPQSFHSQYYNVDEFEKENIEKFEMLRTLGISAEDMVGMVNERQDEKISLRDLEPFSFPDEKEFIEKKILPINLGNYIKWDVKSQVEIIKDLYGWETDELEGVPDELNPYGSKIECFMQGTRDYIKYLKRGFSRITQNSSQLINDGVISIEQAKKITEANEGQIPPSLDIFLDFINMDKKDFYEICESMEVYPHKRDKKKNYKISKKTSDFDKWFKVK